MNEMLHFVQHDRFLIDIFLLHAIPKSLVVPKQDLSQGKIDLLWFRMITDHNNDRAKSSLSAIDLEE